MSPEEFTQAMQTLGLNQIGVANFLKKKDRIIRRYQRGETPVPYETEVILRLMLAMKLTPQKVQEWLS